MNVIELNQRISLLYSAFILKLKNKNVKEIKFSFDFSKKIRMPIWISTTLQSNKIH